jgi:hypothetical protein
MHSGIDESQIEPGPTSSDAAHSLINEHHGIKSLCDELTSALSKIVSCSPDSTVEIEHALDSAEQEIKLCMSAANRITGVKDSVEQEILPSILLQERELQSLLFSLDAMEEIVIPAMNEDLSAIEVLVGELEKRLQVKKSSSTFNSLFNFLSIGSSSTGTASSVLTAKDIASTQSYSSGVSQEKNSPRLICNLHDPKYLLAALKVSKMSRNIDSGGTLDRSINDDVTEGPGFLSVSPTDSDIFDVTFPTS